MDPAGEQTKEDMSRPVVEKRDYLHYVLDNDFTVDLNSNDAAAERVSDEHSIRAHWKARLPLKIKIKQESWEVAVAKVMMKNVQTNTPKRITLRDKKTGGFTVEKEMRQARYETEGEVLDAVYEAMDGVEFQQSSSSSSADNADEEMFLLGVNSQHAPSDPAAMFAFEDFSGNGHFLVREERNVSATNHRISFLALYFHRRSKQNISHYTFCTRTTILEIVRGVRGHC